MQLYKSQALALSIVVFGISVWNSCASTGEKVESRAEEVERREEVRREIGLGRLVAAKIIARYGVYKNPEITKYINMIGKGIGLYAGRPELNFHFAVLDTDVVNAFAAPGGYIFITKGLIKVVNDESELASILAHEIAHVNRKHILKSVKLPKASKTFAERMAAIMGARDTLFSAAFGKIAEQANEILFQKGIKRQDEFEADEYGMKYAYMTGYDAEGLIRFLELLKSFEAKHGKDKAYSAHPGADDRLNRLKKIQAESGFSGGNKATSRLIKMKALIN